MRKRWPAIEPHWRVLYADGVGTDRMTHGEARQYVSRLRGRGFAISCIIKVTPK